MDSISGRLGSWLKPCQWQRSLTLERQPKPASCQRTDRKPHTVEYRPRNASGAIHSTVPFITREQRTSPSGIASRLAQITHCNAFQQTQRMLSKCNMKNGEGILVCRTCVKQSFKHGHLACSRFSALPIQNTLSLQQYAQTQQEGEKKWMNCHGSETEHPDKNDKCGPAWASYTSPGRQSGRCRHRAKERYFLSRNGAPTGLNQATSQKK